MSSTPQLAADYQAKRDLMIDILGRHGFTATSRAARTT